MDDDEMRQFLATWLMYFGTEAGDPYDASTPGGLWYVRGSGVSLADARTENFLVRCGIASLEYRLTDKGLAFIKGEDHG